MSAAAKAKDTKPEPIALSEAAVRYNAAIIEYCRTSISALAGSTAGLLGLTGFYGFAFYVFSVVGVSVFMLVVAGPKWNNRYISRRSLLTNGFFAGLFTYILFWTFIYGMVHVY